MLTVVDREQNYVPNSIGGNDPTGNLGEKPCSRSSNFSFGSRTSYSHLSFSLNEYFILFRLIQEIAARPQKMNPTQTIISPGITVN